MPSFHKTSERVDFEDFLGFVAVRSFTAVSSVNTTPHTSIFRTNLHAHAWLKFGSALTHPISCFM